MHTAGSGPVPGRPVRRPEILFIKKAKIRKLYILIKKAKIRELLAGLLPKEGQTGQAG